MPFLIFLAGVIGVAAVWYYRLRVARHTTTELMDMANDVRLAARRFGFKRQTNIHPVDSIDDARLAGAGLVAAVAGMSGPLSANQINDMSIQFQSVFGVDKTEATEITTFGRWIAEQSGTKSEAVRRLSSRLRKLAGAEANQDLQAMITAVVGAENFNEDQTEAVDQIARSLTH